jgi:hypothetical protein
MATPNHTERAHALLSASGASRWLNCTPSARLEEQFEDKGTTSYAAEGTLAHELSEWHLRKFLKMNDNTDILKIAEIQASEFYSEEMEDEVSKYVTYVIEQFNEAKRKTEGALLLIEQKVDLTSFIKEGFGTNDAIIIADGTMEVIDLKYGKGIRVSAVDNSQLKLYGLGALLEHELSFDIHDVKLTIVQPRLDAISSWEIAAIDLQNWGDQFVRPRALLAFDGKGQVEAGIWCKWCKAKNRCKTLAAKNMEVAKYDFALPNLLTDEELIEVYEKMDAIQDWISSVGVYILDEALKGKIWPGYKLVEGKSNRKWTDEAKVIEELKPIYKQEDYLNIKLKGLTDITKLLGSTKFNTLLSPFIVKPQGKPTLVPESDKRPALGVNQAKADFENLS